MCWTYGSLRVSPFAFNRLALLTEAWSPQRDVERDYSRRLVYKLEMAIVTLASWAQEIRPGAGRFLPLSSPDPGPGQSGFERPWTVSHEPLHHACVAFHPSDGCGHPPLARLPDIGRRRVPTAPQ